VLLIAIIVFQPVLGVTERFEKIRSIGVLIGIAESDPEAPRRVAALRQGLQELGWVEGQNIQIAYRWAPSPDQIRVSAKELVAEQPEVIVASSSVVAAALLRETSKIPIVFATAADPVGDGLVASLARPGGNATGFTNSLDTMGGKWLELLKEIAPEVTRVGVMFNRNTAPRGGDYYLAPIQAIAKSTVVKTQATPVSDRTRIEGAFASLAGASGGGMIVMPDSFTTNNRGLIIEHAAKYRIPAIHPFRYFAREGGLIAYGPDMIELYRRAPTYVDRVLKGAKPAELPVQPPPKFELVINLNTAQSLGLKVPRLLLARADEVIE
jgi:putative ABC transport system substrate-binding protein